MPEEQELICPIMTAGTSTRVGKEGRPIIANCQKDRCALWDKADSACAILSIKIELLKISEGIADGFNGSNK